MSLAKVLCLAVLSATLLIAGCAAPRLSAMPGAASWHGRLAVRVDPGPAPSQALSYAAGFDLVGNLQEGELMLYTPLGTTLAALSWSARTAVLRNAEGSQSFESLDALIKKALGTEVPLEALFAWLAGDTMSAAGWSADLSGYAKGSILARRSQPKPAAEIRLLLEK